MTRAKNPMRHRPCGCEHIDHDNHEWEPHLGRVPKPRVGHRYGRAHADGGWAMWVGHVCKECAETHMKDYMVGEHVCGEGDCWRGRAVEMEMERRRLVVSGRKASGQVYSYVERHNNPA